MTAAAPGPTTLRFEPDRCANCFEPLPADDTHRPLLFCSDLCRDYGATIRYWRKAARTGALANDPSVREALATRIAHLLAGGYNATARRIPAETRALVIERDKVCVNCGRPGEEIDHIDGDSNDPGNLQYLCAECHHAKTRSHMVPASSEETALMDRIEKDRVMPDEPAQICDDETFWEDIHRQLARERIARLRGTKPGCGTRGLSSEEILKDIAAKAHMRPRLEDVLRNFWDAHSGISPTPRAVAPGPATDAALQLLTAAEVAEKLHVSPSTVRHYKAVRKLYSYLANGRLVFPDWQFTQDGDRSLPGLHRVLSTLPDDLHPGAVAGFFLTPQPDLVMNGEAVPVTVWLEKGGSVAPVQEMAAALAAGY